MAITPTLDVQTLAQGDLHAETQAAAEHASGGLPQFESQHWAGQIGYLLILFVILYVLVAKVFTPRLRKVMDERAQTIDSAVATARSVQAEAAEQAEAARAEVQKARADARATAAAAKQRVTEEFNARLAADEAVVNARIAEAESAIARTRDAAMTNVAAIAADAAGAMLDRLTGSKATDAELAAAIKGSRLMPAFLTSQFYDIANPELWVAVGLLIFVAIVVMAGAPRLVAASLDAKAAAIQADLDEAARLRAEAEAMLAQIRQEKAEAEAQAAELLAAAQADAKRLEADAKTRIEESTARRQALAERRIAQAEAEATQEVKAAAADLAARAAQQILAGRIAGAKSDPLLDEAIAQINGKLN